MKYRVLLSTLILSVFAFAQKPIQLSSSEIFAKMQKLNVLGKVLYLAAHPDDENTRFIAYCANQKMYETAYMSLTRGDGGQNLVGPELREELGLIRTQELLMARRVDGGKQFFSRANDFGYSKNPEETFAIWNKELVLGDLVYVIRAFQPDVIVCRFPSDGRGGHGHHTASALLGEEAFKLAADSTAYPEQLGEVKVWQAKRLVTNTGRWWNDTISEKDKNVVTEDIGTYSTLLGTSCNEIAADSRSMHKSQGFGSTGTRGELMEYFEHVDGIKAESSLFDNVDDSWNRLPGGKSLIKAIQKTIDKFNYNHPELSIPNLVSIRKSLDKLEDNPWVRTKKVEVEELILQCAGLFVQAKTKTGFASPGDSVEVQFEVISRSYSGIRVSNISSFEMKWDEKKEINLETNKGNELKESLRISDGLGYSDPYWLKKTGTLGTYALDYQALVLKPDNDGNVHFTFTFEYLGLNFTKTVPLVFKSNDPVKGELVEPFYVIPKVSVRIEQDNILVRNKEEKTLIVYVKNNTDEFNGHISLNLPQGWTVGSYISMVQLGQKNEEKAYEFRLIPSVNAVSGKVSVSVRSAQNQLFNKEVRVIHYDHIPTQMYMRPAEANLNMIDLKKEGKLVGYINGAGDEVADAIRMIGYSVDAIDEKDMNNLEKYDAIILGIRALNTIDRIDFIMPNLLSYVEKGGNLIVQYNTNHSLKTTRYSPYSLKISRDRVTDETAKVTFLDKDHPAMNFPNLLTTQDFDGWVQERGLYFPNEWSDDFTPLIQMSDPGEKPTQGSLLVAQFGKGFYVYTGISFFRQFPEGVPGAYRLLANLISLGHE